MLQRDLANRACPKALEVHRPFLSGCRAPRSLAPPNEALFFLKMLCLSARREEQISEEPSSNSWS